ncbi:hypothetical protein [Deinococcus sp.]|nr:hypothetical protein [Deinococcus sp.]
MFYTSLVRRLLAVALPALLSVLFILSSARTTPTSPFTAGDDVKIGKGVG